MSSSDDDWEGGSDCSIHTSADEYDSDSDDEDPSTEMSSDEGGIVNWDDGSDCEPRPRLRAGAAPRVLSVPTPVSPPAPPPDDDGDDDSDGDDFDGTLDLDMGTGADDTATACPQTALLMLARALPGHDLTNRDRCVDPTAPGAERGGLFVPLPTAVPIHSPNAEIALPSARLLFCAPQGNGVAVNGQLLSRHDAEAAALALQDLADRQTAAAAFTEIQIDLIARALGADTASGED